MGDEIKKEDYEEPRCVLCTDKFGKDANVQKIPEQRVIAKLDEYLGKNDYVSAEKHLLFWLMEADAGNDDGGLLMIRNELMGLYRKLGRKEKALENADIALDLIVRLNFQSSISGATTMVNVATVYKAFGKAEQSIEIFERAKTVYEKFLKADDGRLGGLYNNMALALVDLKRYEEGKKYYEKAIETMSLSENGQGEMAITELNIANLIEAENGLEEGDAEITDRLNKALELLNTPTLAHDGHYAFICEKCASVFGYYGHFATEQELLKRAKDIYEGN